MKILHNGEEKLASENIFGIDNRAFRYGDSFFESIRLANGKGLFLEQHFQRLTEASSVLKFKLPAYFNEGYFIRMVNELAQVNGVNLGGRGRLVIFREDGGFYGPEGNKASWVLTVEPHELNEFELNKKGLKVDIYEKMRKPLNFLSNLKTGNSLLFVMASIDRQEHNFDDLILLNEQGYLCEATSSNLYLIKEGTILTPSLESGCLDGIMRRTLKSVVDKIEFKWKESAQITQEELLEADEVLISSAVKGIWWVGAYQQKRYFNNVAKELTAKLNEFVKIGSN